MEFKAVHNKRLSAAIVAIIFCLGMLMLTPCQVAWGAEETDATANTTSSATVETTTTDDTTASAATVSTTSSDTDATSTVSTSTTDETATATDTTTTTTDETATTTDTTTETSDETATTTNTSTTSTDTTTATTLSATVSTTATSTTTLEDGVYTIASAVGDDSYIDIAGGSTENGGVANIYSYNETAAQRYYITQNDDGYYTIMNVNSGKLLEVPGAIVANGTTIAQYTNNGTYAQQWMLIADSQRSGYYIIANRLNSNYVLDVTGASSANGTLIQLYEANGTIAQSFLFNALTSIIDDGVYVITNVGSGKVLDVSGASLDNCANVQQYTANDTLAQSYQINYDSSTGYYTILNASSGKVLDVDGAGNYNGANVQQYTSNNTAAQRWMIYQNSDGTYRFVSATGGRVLDISCGSTADMANAQLYEWNGTNAQRWTLTALGEAWLPEGTYQIIAENNHSNALGIDADSISDHAAVTTRTANATYSSQKWQVVYAGDGYYKLINLASGRAMDVTDESTDDGTIVQQYQDDGSDAQLWMPVVSTNGIMLVSKLQDGLVLDISGSSTSTYARVQVYTSNNTTAQRFHFLGASLLADTTYTIYVTGDEDRTMVLDITGASTADGAVLQVYESNSTGAQRFVVESEGDGTYRIYNANSEKYLTVSDNGITQQSLITSDSSQLFAIAFNDDADSLTITSVYTGELLSSDGSTLSFATTSESGNNAETGFLFVNYRTVLNGFDISSYQAGLDLSQVASDFVIVKATQGTDYINPYEEDWAADAVSLGKLLGLYHYYDTDSTAEEQAVYFVNQVSDYVGTAMLILDWEGDALSLGVDTAKTWLDTVYNLTGVKPVIYTSKSVTRNYDWSSVVDAGYELWVAQYASYDTQYGYDDDPWTDSYGTGAWDSAIMFQYTSSGVLPGYDGNLDLDVFYGDADLWNSLASA